MSELRKMEQLKSEVHGVAETNEGLLHSLGATLRDVENLRNCFKQMRQETDSLREINKNMCKNLDTL